MKKSNYELCSARFFDHQLLFVNGKHNHLIPPPHKPTTDAKNYLAKIIENNPVIQNHDIKYGNGCPKASTIHISLQNNGKLASEKRKLEREIFGKKIMILENLLKL